MNRDLAQEIIPELTETPGTLADLPVETTRDSRVLTTGPLAETEAHMTEKLGTDSQGREVSPPGRPILKWSKEKTVVSAMIH